jgi:uncharacterized damage-inducible protein DinB
MINTRAGLLRLAGGNADLGWGEVFNRGAELADASGYPARERIEEVSRDVNAKLYAALAALTEADLATPATRPVTPAVKTLGDQIAFLTMHDTYHVGQLAYVRKALGLPGVVG